MMTFFLLISGTFSDLFLQFILIIPEVLHVVIFSLLEKTHYNMEHVPFAIMVYRYGITSPMKSEIQHLLKASEKIIKIHFWSLM